MKKIINSMLYVICVACLTACEDMNSVNQEYLDRGEGIYIARVDSIKSISGLNKVHFTWWLKGDPRITQTEITWTERETVKKEVITAVRTQSGAFSMETLLSDIPEGTYYFEFITKDDYGNRSIALGITVEIIGIRYLETVYNRTYVSAILADNGKMVIKWDSNPSYSVGCYLSYVNLDDQNITVFVQGTDNSTEIIGYKSNLSYYTRCVPPQAILDTLDMDTINPVVIESTPFNGPHIISASGENIVPARDFDFGGEGLAFHDDGNNDTGHNYRSTNGDPEGDKADVEGNGNIGYSNPGEWFVYTIEVQDAGVYAVDIYESGEGNGKFSVSIDGDKSETIDVPSNGNWSNWRWLLETNPNAQPKFRLSAGKHKFRFTYEASGFNYMAFRLNYVGE